MIRCDCGTFCAELTGFPKNTPGRLMCYCDDCQAFMRKMGREDLLDEFGGTEVVPVYPSEVVFVSGVDVLRCNRLTPRGLDRWSVTCCGSPIANTQKKLPWVGVFHRCYVVEEPTLLEKTLGPVRSRINGKFAKGTPSVPIANTLDFRAALCVAPFIIKGKLFAKSRPCPFYEEDGRTPISTPVLL